jgi:hypothetical protein
VKNFNAWLNRLERTLAQQAEARRHACTTCGEGPINLVVVAPPVFRTIGEIPLDAWSASPRDEDFCERCGRRVTYRIPSPQRARG